MDRARRYPSDLTDVQWEIIEPMLPLPKWMGRPEKHPRRAVIDAIRSISGLSDASAGAIASLWGAARARPTGPERDQRAIDVREEQRAAVTAGDHAWEPTAAPHRR